MGSIAFVLALLALFSLVIYGLTLLMPFMIATMILMIVAEIFGFIAMIED